MTSFLCQALGLSKLQARGIPQPDTLCSSSVSISSAARITDLFLFEYTLPAPRP